MTDSLIIKQPLVIEPVMQKYTWDCGIVCLQMLTGAPYIEIRKKIRYKMPVGMSLREMKSVSKRLGFPLSFSKEVDHDDVGILILTHSLNLTDAHAVMFAKGTIYNPAQGQWWMDVDSYLAQTGYEKLGILQRKETA